jgi:hypothetical protein
MTMGNDWDWGPNGNGNGEGTGTFRPGRGLDKGIGSAPLVSEAQFPHD